MSRFACFIAQTILVVCVMAFVAPTNAYAFSSLHPLQQSGANATLNREAVRAVTAWAESEGLPYRNIAITDVESDGVFATVGGQIESRASRIADWQTKTLMLDCRKVGSRWRCDEPALIEYAMIGQLYDEEQKQTVLAGMRPDGTVVQFGSHFDLGPMLSPQGDRIAIARETTNNEDQSDNQYQIELLDQSGIVLQVLEDVIFPRVFAVDWSLDGGSLAIAALGDGQTGADSLMLWDTATDNLIVLDQAAAIRNPAWSPNGQQLAYAKQNQDTTGYSLILLDIASRDSEIIAEEISVGNYHTDAFSWSFDGGYLVYRRDREDYSQDIWLYESDSGVSKKICGEMLGCFAPGWFPNTNDLLVFRQIMGVSGTIHDSRFIPSRITLPSLTFQDLPISFLQLPVDGLWFTRISPDGDFAALAAGYGGDTTALMRLEDGYLWDDPDFRSGQWHPRMPALDLKSELALFCQPTYSPETPALLFGGFDGPGADGTTRILDAQGNCGPYPLQLSRDAAFSDNLAVVGTRFYDPKRKMMSIATLDTKNVEMIHAFPLNKETYPGRDILDVTPEGNGIVLRGEGMTRWFYLAGSDEERPREIGAGNDWNPGLSPDGRKYAYCDELAADNKTYVLAVYDVETNETTPLHEVPDPSGCRYMEWTADSQSIFGVIPRLDDGSWYLGILDISTGSVSQVESSDIVVTYNTLSLDGSRAAFIALDLENDAKDLLVKNIRSGEYLLQLPITSLDNIECGVLKGYWSPNGRYIALSCWDEENDGYTYIIEVETGTIWHIPEIANRVHWYPDVEEIDFPDQWIVGAIGETGR